MKIKEWAEFHRFDEEDVQYIDKIKKTFGGKIDIVRTDAEYKEYMRSISTNNKINIDRLWIK